jgi:hypothetical protein
MHEARLDRFRSIRESMDATHAPVDWADQFFGGYLTLLAGIAHEEGFIAWCEQADKLLEERAAKVRSQAGQ